MRLLEYLFGLLADYADPAGQNDLDVITYANSEFHTAIANGKTQALAELMKRGGAGIPFDQLIKKSGVEVKEKPKYYQGLSIHGQKRADWAAAGRGQPMERVEDKHPPLLEAAKNSSLESVEWLLSTAPLRHYAEFAKKHKHDKRLRRLAQANGGFEQSIKNFMNARRMF
jgi:hypothetical protein